MEIMRAKNRARGIFMHASRPGNGARTSVCVLIQHVLVCLCACVCVSWRIGRRKWRNDAVRVINWSYFSIFGHCCLSRLGACLLYDSVTGNLMPIRRRLNCVSWQITHNRSVHCKSHNRCWNWWEIINKRGARDTARNREKKFEKVEGWCVLIIANRIFSAAFTPFFL